MAIKKSKNKVKELVDKPKVIHFKSVTDFIKKYSPEKHSNLRVGVQLQPNQRITDLAEPYRHGAMHYSHSKPANGMLIAQYNFPLVFDKDKDKITGAYTDRAYSWNWDHADETVKKYMTNKGSIEDFFQNEDPAKCLEFIVKFLKADMVSDEDKEKGVEPTVWTGYRVLGFVNTSGFALYYYGLFAKGKDSDTPVYSSIKAPNVYPIKKVEGPREMDGQYSYFSYYDNNNWNDGIYFYRD